ncbi:efflux RND transporter periplasmic adaptor subunit [Klebsiella pneumoniae]|uniref:efflux RND transporter periplasmic adaptor subunit n=1 Tax=Klebsiella pneumoniae TaxID=573 RepID=UPI000E2E40EB|nr:efflux RND transporter periplasmic adaptor subunit [Klebsiella pneumoniae]SWG03703.1 RND efflux system [Klebsiella pneumoniae]
MSLQKTWGNIHLTALGAMMLSFLLVGCDDSVAQNAAPPAPTVSAAKVLVKSISQWDSFNGRIEAVESVQLRPRVSGYIDKVNYTDGQEVKKGQVLFTIDDRTYRAALEQAQADIRAAQAAVDAAQLNLDFTKVTAPIDGRASRALITSGNLVTAGDTASVLTTLVSQKTVYVYFDVDESTYLHYQNLARRGQGASSDNQALPVEIGLVGEEGYPHQGKVDFLDNQLTPSTGTIRMRALLDNSQRLFTPGLFARVRLPGSAEFKATLIDDKAVLTDQDRKYVYIVDKDGKAQRRDITPGRLADGLRIVQKGLNPGDSVIVDGLQKVFMPGMPVNAKTVAMTSSATLN